MPGGVFWTTTRECLSTVRNVTSVSLGWAIGRWVRWASRSCSTTSVSIQNGCVTSVRPSAQTDVSLTLRQHSGTTTATMWRGQRPCLLVVICFGDSMVIARPSTRAIQPSKNGYNTSLKNTPRMVLSIVGSMPIGAYLLISWNSSTRKTLRDKRM